MKVYVKILNLMKQYRQFIVSKFGKEENASGSDSNDDRWGETHDFTSVYSNKKSAKKESRLENSNKRSNTNLDRIPESIH